MIFWIFFHIRSQRFLWILTKFFFDFSWPEFFLKHLNWCCWRKLRYFKFFWWILNFFWIFLNYFEFFCISGVRDFCEFFDQVLFWEILTWNLSRMFLHWCCWRIFLFFLFFSRQKEFFSIFMIFLNLFAYPGSEDFCEFFWSYFLKDFNLKLFCFFLNFCFFEFLNWIYSKFLRFLKNFSELFWWLFEFFFHFRCQRFFWEFFKFFFARFFFFFEFFPKHLNWCCWFYLNFFKFFWGKNCFFLFFCNFFFFFWIFCFLWIFDFFEFWPSSFLRFFGLLEFFRIFLNFVAELNWFILNFDFLEFLEFFWFLWIFLNFWFFWNFWVFLRFFWNFLKFFL